MRTVLGKLMLGKLMPGAIAIAIVTSGCVGSNQPSTAGAENEVRATVPNTTMPDRSRSRPTAGSCRADGRREVAESKDDPQPTVPCDQPHGLETWKVADLPEKWNDWPERPDSDGRDGRAVYDEIEGSLCTQDELDDFLGRPRRIATDHGLRSERSAISSVWFFPTAAEWQAGARWIRCDVGLAYDDDWRTATGSFRDLAKDTAKYRWYSLCNDSTRVVPCTEAHTSELISAFEDIPPGGWPSTAAGGDAFSLAYWKARCEEDALAFITADVRRIVDMRPASKDNWEKGYRWVVCALSFEGKDGYQRTVGSARAIGRQLPTLAP
ncbi:MAG: septum formation family protein [Actinobacteria bacterium]|nr:septum formation family protein [Actinomycetota bacterium]